MKLPKNRVDVRKNVGVIVFDVVDDQGARPVVHELRPLVEERRVVLVRLDDKVLRRPEPRRDTEVARHTADEKARLESRVLEDPRQHARGRRLAVRAGHRQHPTIAQYVFGKPRRPGIVRTPGIEERFDDRLAARQRVADDHMVHAAFHRCVVALHERDAKLTELRAHRWVDVLIGAGHVVPGFLRDGGDSSHECAADTENVNAH